MNGRTLTIQYEGAGAEERARDLAAKLSASSPRPVPGDAREGVADGLVLVVREAGLSLRSGTGPEVTASVEALEPPSPNVPDQLWRATLSGAEPVVDATAGLGGDGFHLAARGAEVTMIERSPLIAALLRDALERARSGALGRDAAISAQRVELLEGDARDILRSGAVPRERSGVVYLDPMFHAGSRRAAPPKGMALFRDMFGEADAEGAPDLLEAARETASRRVVVKRHLRAPPLEGVAPSGDIRARTIRFDLYVPLYREA